MESPELIQYSQSLQDAWVLRVAGFLAREAGDLDKTEMMHRKALEIGRNKEVDACIADQCLSVGEILLNRYQYNNKNNACLDEAEQLFAEALKIEDNTEGRKEQKAFLYNKIGIVYRERNDFTRAEEMHLRSLAAQEERGDLNGVASAKSMLALVHKGRGEYDISETLLREALELDEKCENEKGIACDLANLGGIFRRRGNVLKTREYWTRAHEAYVSLGMVLEARKLQQLIEKLPADEK